MTRSPHFESGPHSGLIGRVVGVLRQQIRNGTWPVGTRIPTEPELSAQTGVGRNTVREAVQSLVHAGLLERRQGSGTYVLADNEVVVQSTRFVTSETASHQAAVEAFGALWVKACACAAERRSPADAETLKEATVDLVGDPTFLIGAIPDLAPVNRRRGEVHPIVEVILRASGSQLVADMALGILHGLGEQYVLTCSADLVLSCSRAISAGLVKEAREAGERVAEQAALAPSLLR